MIWSICETIGQLAQGSWVCTGMFTQDDPDIVIKDALDKPKMFIISKLSFSEVEAR